MLPPQLIRTFCSSLTLASTYGSLVLDGHSLTRGWIYGPPQGTPDPKQSKCLCSKISSSDHLHAEHHLGSHASPQLIETSCSSFISNTCIYLWVWPVAPSVGFTDLSRSQQELLRSSHAMSSFDACASSPQSIDSQANSRTCL